MPRKPMYICGRHGPIPVNACFKLTLPASPEEPEHDLNVDYCPLCLAEKMDKASEILKEATKA